MAALAADHERAHAIRSSQTFGENRVDFTSDIPRSTIGAFPFFEEIYP